jgi:hypothetical protein
MMLRPYRSLILKAKANWRSQELQVVRRESSSWSDNFKQVLLTAEMILIRAYSSRNS